MTQIEITADMIMARLATAGLELTEDAEHNSNIHSVCQIVLDIVKEYVQATPSPALSKLPLSKFPCIEEAEEEPTPKTTPKTTPKPNRKTPARKTKAKTEEEPKPKRKTKAKVAKSDDEPEKTKKAPTPFALFTAFIRRGQEALESDEPEEVFNTHLVVKFKHVTPSVKLFLEDDAAAPMKAMIDTEQPVCIVLQTAIDALKQMHDGKVSLMKLAAIMWSALNHVQPGLTSLALDDPTTDDTDEE